MRQLDERGHVDLDHFELSFERNLREGADRSESRVVDQQIHPAPSALGRVVYLSGPGSSRQIGFDHCDVNAVARAQPTGQSVKPVTRTSGDNDVRAIGGEPAREGFANSI